MKIAKISKNKKNNKLTSATVLAFTSASTQSTPKQLTVPPNCFTTFNLAGEVVLGTYTVIGMPTSLAAYAYYHEKQTNKQTFKNNHVF